MIRHLEITRSNHTALTEYRFDALREILRDPNTAIDKAKKETSRIMWQGIGRGNIYFNNVEGINPNEPTRTQVTGMSNPSAIVTKLTSDKGIQTALMDGLDVLSNAALSDLLTNMAKEGHQPNFEFEKIVLTPGKDGKVKCQLVGKVTSITDTHTAQPIMNSDDDPQNPLIKISLSFTLEGQLPTPGQPAKIKPVTDASLEVDINASKANDVRSCLPKTKSILEAEQSATVAHEELLKTATQIEIDTRRDQLVKEMVGNIDKYGTGALGVTKRFIDKDTSKKKDALKNEFRDAIIKLKQQNFKTPDELFKKIEELVIQYHIKNLHLQNPKPINEDKEKKETIDKLTFHESRKGAEAMGWPTNNEFARLLNTIYDSANKSLPKPSTPTVATQPDNVPSHPS